MGEGSNWGEKGHTRNKRTDYFRWCFVFREINISSQLGPSFQSSSENKDVFSFSPPVCFWFGPSGAVSAAAASAPAVAG